MRYLNVILKKIREWYNDSWLKKTIPFGGFVYASSFGIIYLKIPNGEYIAPFLWGLYGLMIWEKYKGLREKKKGT
jgi:hypothetical protein